MWHIQYTTLSVIKKDKILPFSITWIDLEGIILSEINEMKTNTKGSHLYVGSKKTKQSSDTKNRMVVARGACVGGGKMDERSQQVQTLVILFITKVNASLGCNVQYGDYSS